MILTAILHPLFCLFLDYLKSQDLVRYKEKEMKKYTVTSFPILQMSFFFSDCSNYTYKSTSWKNIFPDTSLKASRNYLEFVLPQDKRFSLTAYSKTNNQSKTRTHLLLAGLRTMLTTTRAVYIETR